MALQLDFNTIDLLTDAELLQASCRGEDPEYWFPKSGRSGGRIGKKVCINCDIRQRCLEVALANDEPFGIWGGLDAKERRQLMRRRKKV